MSNRRLALIATIVSGVAVIVGSIALAVVLKIGYIPPPFRCGGRQ